MFQPSGQFNLQRSLRATFTALAIVFALMVVATQAAQAQTYNVIHNFTDTDGAYPHAGVTIDRAGSLYGTTTQGGAADYGAVFKLAPKSSGWIFSPLYSFQGGHNDGANPTARVVFGPDGSLYGTTGAGGIGAGYGTVFNLRPPATACKTALCPWTEAVLYRFTGGSDGAYPLGDVIFDEAGNLYGAARGGGIRGGNCGNPGCGTIYKLTPSNGGWTQTLLYGFSGESDGGVPNNVIFDNAGNLYGTTGVGGNLGDPCGGSGGCGVVFQLTPSGSGWTENVLYAFQDQGYGFAPVGLIFDQSANLYGGTADGVVYELSPSNGEWIFALLYSLGYEGPAASLTMDAAGNLYGTTYSDGAYGRGSAFKLTHGTGGWTYTSLHDFTDGSDGGYPVSNLVFDAKGNLYGTTTIGGSHNYGVVFEITP